MQLFPSRRAARKAQTRLVVRFFGFMALLAVAFAVAVAGRYLLALW
jgi:hypothetical protein